MIEADSLSRNSTNNVQNESKMVDKVIKLNQRYNFRKSILDKIKEAPYDVSKRKLQEILRTCLNKKPKIGKKASDVMVQDPEELVAVYYMQFGPSIRVVLLIEYFTRKIYGKYFNSKEACMILEFNKETYDKLKFNRCRIDNGRKFHNKNLQRHCKDTGIIAEYSTLHHYASNGRIERANRAIRNALKKASDQLKEIYRIL